MDVQTLGTAVKTGDLEKVRELLDKGTTTKASDHEGNTLLHYAAKENRRAVAEVLLDHGMDVNITNNSGYTPLHFAAARGFTGVVALLIERGADIHAKTKEHGHTPLHLAVYWPTRSRTETAGLLLAVSPESANIRDRYGYLPQLNNCGDGLQAAVIAATSSAVPILAARRRLHAIMARDKYWAARRAGTATATASSGTASATGTSASGGAKGTRTRKSRYGKQGRKRMSRKRNLCHRL